MATTKWAIDPAHSEIGFKVKHMMFTNVSGKFEKFEADIDTEGDDFSNAKINFSADTDSVTTGSADRDKHLKTPDFFDTANYPKLTFAATGMTQKTGGDFELTGNLTINATTKPVTLQAEFGGIMKDPWGNARAVFTLSGKINRKEWGLNWNTVLEAGGVLVSDEVRLQIDVQLIKQ